MFERMEIYESIYKGVVEPSYKKTTSAYSNCTGHGRLKRGEDALSNTYSDISESTGKRRKIYVDHPRNRSKLTCLIHGHRHSSDESKFLG